MIVNGKKIAADIYDELRESLKNRSHPLCLAVFTCAPDGATQKYLSLKMKRAAELGIRVNVIEFPYDIQTDEVITSIKHAGGNCDGMIVQLPFPKHIDRDQILVAVPREYDVDAVHYQGEETSVLPPVVGAVDEIANRHQISLGSKRVAVIGEGRLVGQPAVIWAKKEGGEVTVIGPKTEAVADILGNADIIISGAGAPGIITPDKIKDGAIIFDAGTSEDGGVLKGDADPACAPKCALFTPVPGGIGPVTIAVLLRNLSRLAETQVDA